jgi:hypothetical protein
MARTTYRNPSFNVVKVLPSLGFVVNLGGATLTVRLNPIYHQHNTSFAERVL